jgi:hypothetical protein
MTMLISPYRALYAWFVSNYRFRRKAAKELMS